MLGKRTRDAGLVLGRQALRRAERMEGRISEVR